MLVIEGQTSITLTSACGVMALIKSNSNNQFENNVFSWQTWSADILQKPEEVRTVFEQLNVTGKKIVDIKPVGYGYNFLCDYPILKSCVLQVVA